MHSQGKLEIRTAQGNGEIYINDWLGGSCFPKKHLLLPQPVLYNLDRDPPENYDAKDYAELKTNPGSPMTPPGAATRPGNQVVPKWIWIPKSRRGKS